LYEGLWLQGLSIRWLVIGGSLVRKGLWQERGKNPSAWSVFLDYIQYNASPLITIKTMSIETFSKACSSSA